MGQKRKLILASILLSFGFLIAFPDIALAQSSGDVGQVENFIRNVIQAIAGLAGLIATGFFVVGGFGYITSSGNPETLERSKLTASNTVKYSRQKYGREPKTSINKSTKKRGPQLKATAVEKVKNLELPIKEIV